MARFKKYDSRFEAHLHGHCAPASTCYYCKREKNKEAKTLGLFKELQYHATKVVYTEPAVEHTYEVDFEVRQGTKVLLIEAKGRFKERREAQKYIWIRDHLRRGQELVFYFDSGNTAMPGTVRRKDGTKLSHGEWATKHGFRWFDGTSIRGIL